MKSNDRVLTDPAVSLLTPDDLYLFNGGVWKEVLNSDASIYGGSGWGNLGALESLPISVHGRHRALNLTLPPPSCVFLEPS